MNVVTNKLYVTGTKVFAAVYLLFPFFNGMTLVTWLSTFREYCRLLRDV